MKLSTWWLDRMIVTDTPLREKLVLLLHEQFPTSYAKVNYADLMYNQNQLFRKLGAGSFETLTQAVAKDPAMLIWLDTGTDHKAHANENFARELMERFTMGVGNYTEEDVRQGARAFTGWELDYTTGEFFFNPYDHDNGEKDYLGHTGSLAGRGHHPTSPRIRRPPRSGSSPGSGAGSPTRSHRGSRSWRELAPRYKKRPQHRQPHRGHPAPSAISCPPPP